MYRHGLSRGRCILVERSIQNALIYGIRRAKHFLYIESQYFEGTPTDARCAQGVYGQSIIRHAFELSCIC